MSIVESLLSWTAASAQSLTILLLQISTQKPLRLPRDMAGEENMVDKICNVTWTVWKDESSSFFSIMR